MALFKNTKIFIELKGMIVSLDAIVASRIHDYFEKNEGASSFFTKELDKLRDQDIRALAQNIMADKNNPNFLLDYFNWNILNTKELSNVNPVSICDSIYKEILNIEDTGNKIFAQIGSGLLMTSISQSFKNLITDDNLNAIYIYVDETIPDYVVKGMNFFYGSLQKIKYVKGSKGKFIKEVPCNSYFIENPEDIDKYFAIPHTDNVEIYIPGSNSNTSTNEVLKGVELKQLTTKKPLEKYLEYNVNVYTLFLPI